MRSSYTLLALALLLALGTAPAAEAGDGAVLPFPPTPSASIG